MSADCGRMTGHGEVILEQNFNEAGQKSVWRRSPLISSKPVSGPRGNAEGLKDYFRIAENPAVGLLWFAFQWLANREQEDGTLVFCVR